MLLEGFRPGVLERLGYVPDELLERFPTLVIGRLSGFGREGPLAPRAGHDINFLALSGVLAAIGPAERPMLPLNFVADFGGGAMHLLAAVLAMLVRRGITGTGGLADTSILAGTLGLTPMFHGLLADGHWTLEREANSIDGGLPYYAIYPTADERFVAVGALEQRFYRNLLELLELDDRFNAEDQYKRDTWPALREAIAARLRERTRDDWALAAEGIDCCLSPVLDFQEAMDCEHNRVNGWISDVPFARPDDHVSFSSDRR